MAHLLSLGFIILPGQSVSGHVVQAKVFAARSPLIHHRNELTERDWENAEQGLGKVIRSPRYYDQFFRPGKPLTRSPINTVNGHILKSQTVESVIISPR